MRYILRISFAIGRVYSRCYCFCSEMATGMIIRSVDWDLTFVSTAMWPLPKRKASSFNLVIIDSRNLDKLILTSNY